MDSSRVECYANPSGNFIDVAPSPTGLHRAQPVPVDKVLRFGRYTISANLLKSFGIPEQSFQEPLGAPVKEPLFGSLCADEGRYAHTKFEPPAFSDCPSLELPLEQQVRKDIRDVLDSDDTDENDMLYSFDRKVDPDEMVYSFAERKVEQDVLDGGFVNAMADVLAPFQSEEEYLKPPTELFSFEAASPPVPAHSRQRMCSSADAVKRLGRKRPAARLSKLRASSDVSRMSNFMLRLRLTCPDRVQDDSIAVKKERGDSP